MKKETLRIVALMLGMIMILGACQSGEVAETDDTSKKEGYGGVLVIAGTVEPDTLNPYSTHLSDEPAYTILEGLVAPNSNMELIPVLAKEVPTLENGLIIMNDDNTMTVKYNLKEGVKWHDGEPFTSADVKFTYEAVSNPTFLAEGKDGTEEILSIETPDEKTVIVNYKYPFPDFADKLFTFGVMPKHLLEGVDLNVQTGWNVALVGTGPFMFKEWKAGEYIEVVKNPNYHVEGEPYLDGLVFKFITDQNTQISQLKTGEVQFVNGLSYNRYDEVKAIPGMNVVTNQLNSWRYIDFNTTKPGLDDKAVRQAFAYGLDVATMCETLFEGIPAPWQSPWMQMDPFYVEPNKKYTYDPEKAKEILDTAGWIMGADGIREKDGVKLQFDFNVIAGRPVDEAVQQVVIDSMKNVGIAITANNGAGSTMTGKWNEGDFDLKMAGWITGPSSSRSKFYSTDAIPPKAGVNHSRWSNVEADRILAEIDVTVDAEKKKELIQQFQDIFIEEVPELILFNTTAITATVDNLEGFEPSATNMTNFWKTSTWKLVNN